MIDPTSDDYFDTPRYCVMCDDVPRDFFDGCGWRHCPACGDKLLSQGEIEDMEIQAKADDVCSVADVAWQIGVEAMRGAA